MHDAGKTGDAHLQALQVLNGLDFLAEPAAHLHAGIAGGHAVEVVLGVELVEQFVALAMIEPGVHLPGVEAEGKGGADGEGRVLAEIIIRAGMAHLDGAVADRVRDLRRADDFAGGEGLDLELAVGALIDEFRDDLGGAVDGVERFREARLQAPFDLGHRLGDRRRGDGRGGRADGRGLQKLTTFHIDDFLPGYS